MKFFQRQANQHSCNVFQDDSGDFYAGNDYLAEPIWLGGEVDPEEISRMRDYQVKQVSLHLEALREGNLRQAVVMPTGAGKTMTARFLMAWPEMRKEFGVKKGETMKVIFIGAKRLLKQADNTFGDLPETDFYFTTAAKSIPSDWDDYHIAIYDEGHHEAMKSWQNNLINLSNDKPIFYLTATPDRKDQRLIKVQKSVSAVKRSELEDRGLLASLEVNSILTPGLKAKDKMALLFEYILKFEQSFGKTLITVKTHKEAKDLFHKMIAIGLRVGLAVDIDGQGVDDIIRSLEDGEIDYIVNCNKLNEGVDIQGLTDVILGRQFGSMAELNQNIGRGVRPKRTGPNIGRIHQMIDPAAPEGTLTADDIGRVLEHFIFHFDGAKWRKALLDNSKAA